MGWTFWNTCCRDYCQAKHRNLAQRHLLCIRDTIRKLARLASDFHDLAPEMNMKRVWDWIGGIYNDIRRKSGDINGALRPTTNREDAVVITCTHRHSVAVRPHHNLDRAQLSIIALYQLIDLLHAQLVCLVVG
jgi:hypothetical protein